MYKKIFLLFTSFCWAPPELDSAQVKQLDEISYGRFIDNKLEKLKITVGDYRNWAIDWPWGNVHSPFILVFGTPLFKQFYGWTEHQRFLNMPMLAWDVHTLSMLINNYLKLTNQGKVVHSLDISNNLKVKILYSEDSARIPNLLHNGQHVLLGDEIFNFNGSVQVNLQAENEITVYPSSEYNSLHIRDQARDLEAGKPVDVSLDMISNVLAELVKRQSFFESFCLYAKNRDPIPLLEIDNKFPAMRQHFLGKNNRVYKLNVHIQGAVGRFFDDTSVIIAPNNADLVGAQLAAENLNFNARMLELQLYKNLKVLLHERTRLLLAPSQLLNMLNSFLKIQPEYSSFIIYSEYGAFVVSEFVKNIDVSELLQKNVKSIYLCIGNIPSLNSDVFSLVHPKSLAAFLKSITIPANKVLIDYIFCAAGEFREDGQEVKVKDSEEDAFYSRLSSRANKQLKEIVYDVHILKKSNLQNSSDLQNSFPELLKAVKEVEECYAKLEDVVKAFDSSTAPQSALAGLNPSTAAQSA